MTSLSVMPGMNTVSSSVGAEYHPSRKSCGIIGSMERDWLSYKNQGEAAEAQHKYELAEAMWAMACILAEQYGEASPHLAFSLDRLGFAMMKQQQYKLAQYVLGRSWHIKTKLSQAPDLDKAVTVNLFAELYFHQGKYVDSKQLCKWVFDTYTANFGAEHPQTVGAANNLAFFERMEAQAAAAPAPAPVSAAPVAPSRPQPIAPTRGSSQPAGGRPRCESCGYAMESDECMRCTGTNFKPISPLDKLT